MALQCRLEVRLALLILPGLLLLATTGTRSNADVIDSADISNKIKSLWTWECAEEKCKKRLASEVLAAGAEGEAEQAGANATSGVTSLHACSLFCGEPGGFLWPLPAGPVRLSGPLVRINANNIDIESATVAPKEMNWKTAEMVHELRKLFTSRWTTEAAKAAATPRSGGGGSALLISAVIEDPDHNSPTLETDESYQLLVENTPNKVKATVRAATFFGLRHGMETLGQLLVSDEAEGSLVIPARVEISDRPAYKYRALTLDTSRNFISVERLKGTLDAMAANKLNVLHWHITDTHSFPLESKRFPNLTIFGAYGADKIYKQSDIKELVNYARVRGVKIIPEFDAPAHVGEGWQWAPPGALLCFNSQPWNEHCVEPPCGQLNPLSEDVYRILGGIYHEMFQLFDSADIFHMGGDEVHYRCWNETADIVDFMEARNWNRSDSDSFLRLWNIFQTRALDLVKRASGGSPQAILWTSTLTTGPLLEEFLDKGQYIIQIWTKGTDPNVKELIEKGYRVIFSNYDALYLDCGFGGWVTDGNNWCSPYIPWQKLYSNDPIELIKQVTGEAFKPEMADQVLGQSAALWTEQADDHSLDGRFWPRAAALAERLWSNPGANATWREAEGRLLRQRERLVKLGVHAEALQPQWCRQNGGDCPMGVI